MRHRSSDGSEDKMLQTFCRVPQKLGATVSVYGPIRRQGKIWPAVGLFTSGANSLYYVVGVFHVFGARMYLPIVIGLWQ
jgi:hypothetical protein